MALYDEIIAVYPELKLSDFDLTGGNKVILADDGDGLNYISKWNYSKPIPDGLKLGK
jgi:hypothetical protein